MLVSISGSGPPKLPMKRRIIVWTISADAVSMVARSDTRTIRPTRMPSDRA